MKKIFSPIIILAMMLTLFSFGCRNAVYKQSESKDPGYMVALLFMDALSGNCAIVIKVATDTYRATAQQLPKLICKSSAKYYVAGAAEATTSFPVATQMLADITTRNAPVDAIFTASGTACDAAKARIATITGDGVRALNPLPASTFADGTALYTGAVQLYADYGQPCLQVGTAFGLDQWFYCLSDAGYQAYLAAREAQVHYQVIGDATSDTAFATNLTAQKLQTTSGSYYGGSFTTEQKEKIGTVDRVYAPVMLQSPEGAVYATVLTAIGSEGGAVPAMMADAACAQWLISPAGGNYANVRKQIARHGSTSVNTMVGITLDDISAVTSPVTYDILLQPLPAQVAVPPYGTLPFRATTGRSRAGLGTICGTSGIIATFTSQYGAAYGSVYGDCAAAGTKLVGW